MEVEAVLEKAKAKAAGSDRFRMGPLGVHPMSEIAVCLAM